MIRVSSEIYDKAWVVNTDDIFRAIELVETMTKKLNWHLDFPDEKRKWRAEKVFSKENEIIECKDL